MGLKAIHCFLLMGLFFCSGTPLTESSDGRRSLTSPEIHPPILEPQAAHQSEEYTANEFQKESDRIDELESLTTLPQMDVDTPITTVPVINPTTPTTNNPTTPTTNNPTYNPNPTFNPNPTYNPTPTFNPTPSNPTTPTTTPVTNPYTAPTTGSSGQSWCVASQTASQTALQVALDYACGFGGSDCSQILPSGSCFNPDTLRDHASYAFNDYYQKNPVSTSCDFGGTAVITNIDPSTSTCQFPSTSTSSSVFNTSNPTGSSPTVFGSGSVPPSFSGTSTMSIYMPLFFTMIWLIPLFNCIHVH